MASTPKITVPIVAYAIVVVVSFAGYCAEASIGINWGRESAQRLVPSQVVDLMLQNGIGHVRIYTSQIDVLAAFRGSGINITTTVQNPQSVESKEKSRDWVQLRKEHLEHSDVKYIFFGEYVFVKGITNKTYIFTAVDSLHLLQEALNEQGFNHVKVAFVSMHTVLKPNATKPSECEFVDEIKPEMADYMDILRENDAPFWVDHIPLRENEMLGYDPEFAFPDNKAFVVNDVGGASYANIVEWRHDCYVWAMTKLNASDIRVSFSQVGWPTDGWPGATAANAERFYKHFLPWVKGNKGTPLRPGMLIDVNVHALADETKMIWEPYTRHWGIFRSNGAPKYKIDLSGQGRDIYPTMIKGIMRMPSRWCVFNGDRRDMEKVRNALESACKESDCTSTLPGGSCSGLSFEQNVSYGFNMRFQFNFQDEKACNDTAFGHVVDENPSTEQCVFPVEVVKGQQSNYNSRAPVAQVNKTLNNTTKTLNNTTKTLNNTTLNGDAFRRSRPSFALLVVWLSILGEILLLV